MTRAAIIALAGAALISGAFYAGVSWEKRADAERRAGTLRERQDIQEDMRNESDDDLIDRITDGLGGLW